jgi:hypothetical protein
MMTIRYDTSDGTNRFVAESIVRQRGGQLEPPLEIPIHDVELIDLDHLPPEGEAVDLQLVLAARAVPTAVHSYHLDRFPVDDLLAAGISVYRTLDEALEAWLPGAKALGNRVTAAELAEDRVEMRC